GPDGKLVADDAHVQPVSFTGGMHKGSPTIFKFCVTGKQIAKCEFHARTSSGDTAHTFFQLILSDCLITNVSESIGSAALPSETIRIAYRKIEMAYMEQDNTGQGREPVTAIFDQAEAAAVDEE